VTFREPHWPGCCDHRDWCGRVAAPLPLLGKYRTMLRRSRLYPSTDSGIVAEMDARSEPGLSDPFEEAIDDALSSLPADLRAAMSNVEIVVENEPPDGRPLLGLYHGVPLPRRSSTYSGLLPDKISIFRGPITRLAAGDADRLRREVRHVVLHEIAHHFGISDARLIELDRY
jgi:predicted Zn-dependent protease with MMP-like domain